MICKLPLYFISSLESIGLFIQEEKCKTGFEDGGHFRFLIGMILALFDLQFVSILPRSFESVGLLVQKKSKIDFQDGRHGGHLGFHIRTIIAIFDLQVADILPTKL